MTHPIDSDGHGKIRDGIDTAREKASSAYESARDKAVIAVETSREKARDAAQQTAATLESNPVGVIVGGLALGAIIAALIPRSQRERDLLAPVGKRVTATAAIAFAAAKEAGKSELDGLGLSRNAAKDQVRALFDGIVKAASSAGTAAVAAGKENVKAK